MLASCRDYFRYCHENSQPRVRATYATLHYRRVPWTSYHYDVICTSYQSMLGRGPQPETWHQEGPKKNEKNESAKVSKTLFLSIIRLTNTNIFIKGPLLIHIRDILKLFPFTTLVSFTYILQAWPSFTPTPKPLSFY